MTKEDPTKDGEIDILMSKVYGVEGSSTNPIRVLFGIRENKSYEYGFEPVMEIRDAATGELLQPFEEVIEDVLDGAIEEIREKAEEAKEAADKAVIKVIDQYTITDSPSDVPTEESEWYEGTPVYTPGTYIWHRYITTYGDGTTKIGDPFLVTGNDGAKGDDGEPAITISILSSNGTTMKLPTDQTVLSATVYVGSIQVNPTSASEIKINGESYGFIKWYDADDNYLVTSPSMTVFGSDITNGTIVYKCKLED